MIPIAKIEIKNGKLIGTLKDGHYVVYSERPLNLNDAWKGYVRFIANHLGESNTLAVEMWIKKIIFLDENIKTSELNEEDFKRGLQSLSHWAFTELGITLPSQTFFKNGKS